MEWLLITLALYRRVFSRAAQLAARNWAVLLTVFVYSTLMGLAVFVAGFLGLIGGMLMGVVWAACVGSLLYLVEIIVRTGKVTLDDFRRSFSPYLADVLGILFVLWVFFTLAGPVILQLPQGFLVLLFVQLAVLVFFNAVPELIYLGHYSSMALLSESYSFIAANWIEWFPANLLVGAVVYALWSVPIGGVGAYLQRAAIGLLVYATMVMRGLLFIELQGSTHRSRAFKYRAQR